LDRGRLGLRRGGQLRDHHKAVAQNATGFLVVEGVMHCDLRDQAAWELERGIPPMCNGEPIEWASVYVNARGQRCGKPIGYLGTYESPSNEPTFTSYAFRVSGLVDLGKWRPTVACLLATETTASPNAECAEFFDSSLCAKEYHDSSRTIGRAAIEWVGPPPPVPKLFGARARGLLETSLENQLGRAFTGGYNRGQHKLDCLDRLGRSRFGCSVQYDRPGSTFSGKSQVWLSQCRSALCWHVSFQIHKTNCSCAYARNKSPRQCTKLLTGREHDLLPFRERPRA
jgi:hypothetical protein